MLTDVNWCELMWTGVNWLYKPTREFFTMRSVSRNRTSCHNFTISQKGWCENGGIDRFFKDTPGGSGYVETWESSRGCSWTQLLLASSYLCFISHDGSIHGAAILVVCHESQQYTPNISINIPAPWIRHGLWWKAWLTDHPRYRFESWFDQHFGWFHQQKKTANLWFNHELTEWFVGNG